MTIRTHIQAFDLGARVSTVLSPQPLTVWDARVSRVSYEAVPAPDGGWAYRVHAELDAGQAVPRLGLRGTAKLHGRWSVLGWSVLRRPVGALRRTLGW